MDMIALAVERDFTAIAIHRNPEMALTTWEVIGPLGVGEITLPDVEAHNYEPWQLGLVLFRRLWKKNRTVRLTVERPTWNT